MRDVYNLNMDWFESHRPLRIADMKELLTELKLILTPKQLYLLVSKIEPNRWMKNRIRQRVQRWGDSPKSFLRGRRQYHIAEIRNYDYEKQMIELRKFLLEREGCIDEIYNYLHSDNHRIFTQYLSHEQMFIESLHVPLMENIYQILGGYNHENI